MNDASQENDVAVLGLGLIGSIYARHLHDAGRLIACWNRTPRPDAPLSVATAREAAEKATTLIIVVADPPAVAHVLTEIAPALNERHLIIQCSTIGPSDSTLFRSLVTATGAGYLEAPFTGSKPAAENKKTVFYLGGDDATMCRAEPVLSLISAQRLHCGVGEQACTIKLAMNLQIAAQAEALCEALLIARRAGVPDDTFFTCMKGNASWSGLAALKEPKLRDGDYSPQFSVKHLLKDLRLLENNTDSTPALRLLIERLELAEQAGRRDKDFISLYQNLT